MIFNCLHYLVVFLTQRECTIPGGTAIPGWCVERTEQAPIPAPCSKITTKCKYYNSLCSSLFLPTVNVKEGGKEERSGWVSEWVSLKRPIITIRFFLLFVLLFVLICVLFVLLFVHTHSQNKGKKEGRKKEVSEWEREWVSLKRPSSSIVSRLRPYHPEHARSRPISEAKQGRAWLVLGWETAWEYQVL